MIKTHCRHKTYPKPPDMAMPTHCHAGIRYDDVRDPNARPIWNAEPCCLPGRDRGLTCPAFEPWSEEEIATDEAEVEALVAALNENRCRCGKALVWRGHWFRCPAGCVSGHGQRIDREVSGG